jgi:hypothetical protein
MRFIDTIDIKKWADSVDCKYNLPHLIRKLILATIDNKGIKNIHFPYGEEVYTGGFDGELSSDFSNVFVPSGDSIWEFGTTDNKKGKADEDYNKRWNNPLGKDPAVTTYVNVNAKKYRDKSSWAAEKKLDRFWKDVVYIDAVDIEQWLELAPSVELWLAEKLRKPTLGIYTIDQYWKLWSESGSLKIVPEILLGDSRKNEAETVKAFLAGEEKVLYIKSITTDEASAFPLAVIQQQDDVLRLKTVVIDNRDSFYRFIQTDEQLVIIAKFKLEGMELREAAEKGHKVIVPISLSEEINKHEKIQLSIVSRESFEAGLRKMGIDHEQADILMKSSGRNISVLKRLLKFDHSTRPKYTESVESRDIIPMLLLNRFSEDFEGDKQIVEKLTDKSFTEYNQFLKVLATVEDSPVYYINDTWRLVSPTDTWLYFAKYATADDFANFQQACLEVLSEVLYKYSLPAGERGHIFQSRENRTRFSPNLREGLCETLVAIAVFGESYGINSIPDVTSYADGISQRLFEMDIIVWRSLSTNLMLLAEASPSVFIRNLERIIKDRSVLCFFEEEKGFMHTSNDLPPLLWCLDITAWFPEHLMRVSNALCELIIMSPSKLPTTNTPFNSLQNIYRAWYPQTNTNAEDRIKILEMLIKRYPDQLYSLLYNLVDSKHDTAFHTPRPKWRLFSELRQIQVSQREVSFIRAFCLKKIIEMSEGKVNRILALINLLDDMEWDRIDQALQAIEIALSLEAEQKKLIFHHFRKLIGNHRSHQSTHWALPAVITDKLERTAMKFQAEADVLNDSYLFEENFPQFMSGRQSADYTKHGEEIAAKRLEFVESIIEKYGIPKIFELASTVEYPYLYGHVLGFSDKIGSGDRLYICQNIENEDVKILAVVQAFIKISDGRNGLAPQIDTLKELMNSGLSVQGTVNFLDSMRDRVELWKFIEEMENEDVQKLYWEIQQGFIYTEDKDELFFALDKLTCYGKSITMINTLGWAAYSLREVLTSEEILTALERVSIAEYQDSSQFEHDHFRDLLDLLYSKEDYDLERAAKIEMKFIFVFTGGSSYALKPKNLYKLMSQNPEEYFGLLSQVYLPDNDELKEAELQQQEHGPVSQEIVRAAWEILDSFNVIPSHTATGSLNLEILRNWVTQVRELAEKSYRLKSADNQLGKLFAKYPIKMEEGTGYPVEIYDIIEEVGTDDIILSFRIQISNNLGFTSRGAFEGGNIERCRAGYFDSLFEATKITHPNVSLIFKELADRYRSEAKRADESALLRSL